MKYDDELTLIRAMGFRAERKRPCLCTRGLSNCTCGYGARVLHDDPECLAALDDQRRAFASRMRAINGDYA